MKTLEEIETWADRYAGPGDGDAHALIMDLVQHVRRLERQVDSLQVSTRSYVGMEDYKIPACPSFVPFLYPDNPLNPVLITSNSVTSSFTTSEVHAADREFSERTRNSEVANLTENPQVL